MTMPSSPRRNDAPWFRRLGGRGAHDRTRKNGPTFFERDVLVACSPGLTSPSVRRSDAAAFLELETGELGTVPV